MLFDLPEFETLYTALDTRDPRYDGRVFVGVASTGIFCRLTCPARTPKRENCRFFETVAECLDAGFRPCKRCHPLRPAAAEDPAVASLIAALEVDPTRVWAERDVVAMGLDPSTVRRAFRRQFGMTFLAMARQRRLQEGFSALSDRGRVIDAQIDAGYGSAAAFRAAFAKLMGAAPSAFTGDEALRADWIATPVGSMIAVCDETRLHLLEFADRKALPGELRRLRERTKTGIGVGRTAVTEAVAAGLARYFAGKAGAAAVEMAYHGSPFTREVWEALREIPAGETRSYSDIARAVGRPGAVRAVARANGAIQIALLIPCHRVIGADGSLTGYGGGLWRKQYLIDLERRIAGQGGDNEAPIR